MSDTENRESTPAPQGEAITPTPIPTDAAAAPAAAPESVKKPTRIAESAFEAAHADLPPLSTLGGSTPAVTATESVAATGNGPRRGRGRGAPAGKFGAPAANTKVPMGAVEDPADMTESLSGKFVAGYTDAPKAPAIAPVVAAAINADAPESTGPKEFVPPVSGGTFKASFDPEAERKAREERRRQREEARPQGEARPPREPREPRGKGEFRDAAPRDQREPRAEREPRTERRFDDRKPGDQKPKPTRVTLEAPKMPVQKDLSFFGKVKAFFARLVGVPARDEVEYTQVPKQFTPHSKEWQFGRDNRGPKGERRDDRGERGNFRHGNHQGGDNRHPARDGRHRPHARGGNHRDHHGRDGNPRG